MEDVASTIRIFPYPAAHGLALSHQLLARHAAPPPRYAQVYPTSAELGLFNRGTLHAVDQSEHAQLEGLRPAVKTEWEALLRSEPAPSPLGNPDTLLYLMDETITQVFKTLTENPLDSVLKKSSALLVPLQRHCTCGLNPLLNYYATGELALHLVAAKRLPQPMLDAVLTSFHLLAQQEIDTLCSVCLNRSSSACQSPAVHSTHQHRMRRAKLA